tara:strand:+ start:87 stop:347 length:261 start_codon:yes stop_codon:yes gene_type:complete
MTSTNNAPRKILVFIIAKMSRPLEIFEENICVIDNNEPIKIRKISIEKIPIAFEIIKNQKENPAVIARDLNLGDDNCILNRINECD